MDEPDRRQAAANTLIAVLTRRPVATIDELKAVLQTAVRMTVYRVLKDIAYQTSYSHGGRYYALKELMEFDQHGWWSARSVWFSKHGRPVAHEHTVEVGPENRGGIVEPATRANGVDRRFRGDERPQPVADGTHPPPGFIRRDHRRVADLLAQRRVGRRGVAGRAMQQVSEAARRHLQAERGPQHVGDLRQRYAHLRVQLDNQGDDAGAELHAGRS